jgi:hypothetical protein
MNWRDVGFLVVGLFVGSNFGLLIYALCHAARRGDELANGSKLKAESEEKTGDGGRDTGDQLKVCSTWPISYTQEWEDDAVVDPLVVFERKVVISKRRR